MSHKRTIPRTCRQCGQNFLASSTEVNRGNAQLCSRECRSAERRLSGDVELLQDGTARIPLRGVNGSIRAYALIDAADAAWANQWRWFLNSDGYADRASGTMVLHRELLGLQRGDGLEGDHINRDTLDNRRSNLRIMTRQGNSQNRRSCVNASSAYRGVTFDKRRGKWLAGMQVDGKVMHIGRFSSEQDAAEAARLARLQMMPGAVD